MNSGELLTRGTIWVALLAATLAGDWLLQGRRDRRWWAKARWAWTLGCAFFLAHVAFAFACFHGWSHLAAYLETERQTAEMTGFRSGAGLYLNYLLAALWLLDVLWWWWTGEERFRQRAQWLNRAWYGFFLFMAINGTIVFGKGPVQWLGAGLCAWLGWRWWESRSPKS